MRLLAIGSKGSRGKDLWHTAGNATPGPSGLWHHIWCLRLKESNRERVGIYVVRANLQRSGVVALEASIDKKMHLSLSRA